MAANPQSVAAGPGSIPELDFRVEGARAQDPGALPTILFELRIESLGGHAVRSILLDTQVQIAARRRRYEAADQERLADIFGAPESWGTNLRTLPWVRTTSVVPPFEASTSIELPLPCSYDLEVIANRYFGGLSGGVVPLEFLFSGTVLYGGAAGALQVSRVSWEKEAAFELPVSLWQQTLERHFPGSAWIRVSQETHRRLEAERARRGEADLEGTLAALIEEEP
ncbi:MAG: DUF6084 family protein [Solirubrobacterales bacterium]